VPVCEFVVKKLTFAISSPDKFLLHCAYKFDRVTMRFGRQTSKFKEIV